MSGKPIIFGCGCVVCVREMRSPGTDLMAPLKVQGAWRAPGCLLGASDALGVPQKCLRCLRSALDVPQSGHRCATNAPLPSDS